LANFGHLKPNVGMCAFGAELPVRQAPRSGKQPSAELPMLGECSGRSEVQVRRNTTAKAALR
jgi:hypothetical protein